MGTAMSKLLQVPENEWNWEMWTQQRKFLHAPEMVEWNWELPLENRMLNLYKGYGTVHDVTVHLTPPPPLKQNYDYDGSQTSGLTMHKSILATGSPVFYKIVKDLLVRTEYIDEIDDEVNLYKTYPNLDEKQFRRMIQFIYTDKVCFVNCLMEEVKTLLELAKLFQVKNLEKLCLTRIELFTPSPSVMPVAHVENNLGICTSSVANPSANSFKKPTIKGDGKSFKEDLITSLKAELLAEIKDELHEELSDKIKDELHDELRKELKDDLKKQLKETLRDEVNEELVSKLRDELLEGTKHDLIEELRDEL